MNNAMVTTVFRGCLVSCALLLMALDPAAVSRGDDSRADDRAADKSTAADQASTNRADGSKAPVSSAPVNSAAAQKTKADFDRLFSQWKELLIQLRHLRNQYQNASSAEREEMAPQYRKLVSQGHALAAKLVTAAEKAYEAAPNADEKISDFLITNVADNIYADRMEEGMRIAQLMIKHNYANAAIYNFAGIAAFTLHDFPNADIYLRKAAKARRIDELGQSLVGEAKIHQQYWEEEQKIRKAEAEADDLPRVKLETSKGDIVLELFENEAPIATANFINLIEQHYYDGLPFHRVIANFMVQGGDDGKGGPGYSIPDECRQANARRHFRGSLSMAKTPEPDSGNAQFFVTLRPTPHLNGKHTVFGRVIEGWEVLPKINKIEPDKGGTPDVIERAEVLRKRDHPYEAKKLPAKKDKS